MLISWAYSSRGLAQVGRLSHSAPVLVSLSSRQLARLARKIATEAMAIELAAERGDWEAIHDAHDRLIGLHEEYRAGHDGWQYQNLNLTLHVSNPPEPGRRPLPSTELCDRP